MKYSISSKICYKLEIMNLKNYNIYFIEMILIDVFYVNSRLVIGSFLKLS